MSTYATPFTHVFFWHSSSPFSNFYPCSFTDGLFTYNCSEQYFMAKKAEKFNDQITLSKILAETSPSKIKLLGRKVKNFDPDVWDRISSEIMFQAIYFKFSQNPTLKQFLLNTQDKVLVEASPKDFIWGIGLNEKLALTTPIDKWPGQNRLGKVLMHLRSIL